MGKIRDFRQDTIEYIRDNLVDENPNNDGFVDGLWETFSFNKNLASDLSNFDKYMDRICEINDITKDKFLAIVADVHAIENEAATWLEADAYNLNQTRDMLRLLCDEIGKDDFEKNFDAASVGLTLGDFQFKTKSYEVAVQMLLDSFFNEDGSLNIEAIQKLLETNPENISDVQWAALAALMLDSERVSYEDILAIFDYYSTSFNGDGGANIDETIEALGAILSQITCKYVEAYLAGADIDQNALEEMLRRTQLVNFIPSIYDCHRNHGKGRAGVTIYKIDTSKLDLDRLLSEGIISYDGTDYQQQILLSIINSASASDYRSALTQYLIDEAYGKDYDWIYNTAMAVLAVVGLVVGLINAPWAATVGTALAIAGVADVAFDMLYNGIVDSDKDAREKATDLNNLATAVDLLGGRIMYTVGPDGVAIYYRSFNTPKAVINLNGLQLPPYKGGLGISPDRALEILSNPNDPLYWDVKNYLTGSGTGTAGGYRTALGQTLDGNKTAIYNRFAEKYPQIIGETQVDNLPLEVLQHVITLHAGGQ